MPSPPGGGTDILARVLAQHFSKAFGQPFVVENKPGAGNMIGIESVARAAADGYTLLHGRQHARAELRALQEGALRPGARLRADHASPPPRPTC